MQFLTIFLGVCDLFIYFFKEEIIFKLILLILFC